MAHLLTINDQREHLLGHLGEFIVRFLVVWLLALRDLTIWIYNEDLV